MLDFIKMTKLRKVEVDILAWNLLVCSYKIRSGHDSEEHDKKVFDQMNYYNTLEEN